MDPGRSLVTRRGAPAEGRHVVLPRAPARTPEWAGDGYRGMLIPCHNTSPLMSEPLSLEIFSDYV